MSGVPNRRRNRNDRAALTILPPEGYPLPLVPLDEGDLITYRDGVLELTATLRAPDGDRPSELGQAVAERLHAHRHLLMTDPDLIEDDLDAASVVATRSELPPEVTRALQHLGLDYETSDTGGRRRGLFGRRRDAVQLERFVRRYVRAADLSPEHAIFEAAIPSPDPEARGSTREGAQAVSTAARSAWGLELEVGPNGVEALERALALRAQPPVIFAPRVVRAMADFITQVLLREHSGAHVVSEDEPHLVIPRPGKLPWTTHPEIRVVEHVCKGPRASLVAYLGELRED